MGQQVNTGIKEKSRKTIAEGLSHLLADTYTLYLKTQNYHWNVTGTQFQALHLMFETQYTELTLAVDLIAERIRALGFFAPGTFKAFTKLSSVKENEKLPAAKGMIKDLVESHGIVIATARSLFSAMEEANDQASLDLVTQRIQLHEKTAWMLRSLLES